MPRQLQVGLTGKSIDPRLYIAVGVRGAPNHTCGLKRAQTVVAINNDADALIFERANIGLVADWQNVLPALQDAFQRRLLSDSPTRGFRRALKINPRSAGGGSA